LQQWRGPRRNAPPVAEKPLFGYFATLLAIAAGTLAIPAVVSAVLRMSGGLLKKLRSRLVACFAKACLGHCAELPPAGGSAGNRDCMMTAGGNHGGQFSRDGNSMAWKEEVPADFYLRPRRSHSVDRHRQFRRCLRTTLPRAPGVEAVDRLRAYEVSYDGVPP